MTISNYVDQINTIQDRLSTIISDIGAIYNIYQQNPTDSTLQTTYTNTQGQIVHLNSELTTISGSLQSEIDTLLTLSSGLADNIATEKTTNRTLKEQLGQIRGSAEASSSYGLIGDAKNLYKLQYFSNINIFIGIILAIIAIIYPIDSNKLTISISNI